MIRQQDIESTLPAEDRELTVALFGLGRVGRAFLELLPAYEGRVRLTGVADSGGAMTGDLDPDDVLGLKVDKGRLPSGLGLDETIEKADPDVVVDLTSCAFRTGEPSLSVIVGSFRGGAHVVTANKVPLARCWDRITDAAADARRRLGYAAAAGAALPAVPVARFLARTGQVESFNGVLTGATTFVLARMAKGSPLADAIALAQERGIAEPDPSMDVGGWDTAAKTVILANTLWGTSSTLDEVRVRGLSDDLAIARGECRTQLVGRGVRDDAGVHLVVEPALLEPNHPLASLDAGDKGVVFSGPAIGRVCVTGGRSSPRSAAEAVIADVFDVVAGR
jgi:homoserine dehydrogenase